MMIGRIYLGQNQEKYQIIFLSMSGVPSIGAKNYLSSMKSDGLFCSMTSICEIKKCLFSENL